MRVLFTTVVAIVVALIIGVAVWATHTASMVGTVLILGAACIGATILVTVLYIGFVPYFKKRSDDLDDDSDAAGGPDDTNDKTL